MVIPRALPIWKKRRMKSPGTPNTCRTPRARSASTRYSPMLGFAGVTSLNPNPPRSARPFDLASLEPIEGEGGLPEDPPRRPLRLVPREAVAQPPGQRAAPPPRGQEVD